MCGVDPGSQVGFQRGSCCCCPISHVLCCSCYCKTISFLFSGVVYMSRWAIRTSAAREKTRKESNLHGGGNSLPLWMFHWVACRPHLHNGNEKDYGGGKQWDSNITKQWFLTQRTRASRCDHEVRFNMKRIVTITSSWFFFSVLVTIQSVTRDSK